MASVIGVIDQNAPDIKSSPDPFPPDVYELEITDTDYKPTKDGNGQILSYTFRVVSGEHEGRLFWGRSNVINPKPETQNRGQSEYKLLRRLTDTPDSTEDTNDLHNKSFHAVVGIEPEKDGWPASNKLDFKATVKLRETGGSPPASKAEPTSSAPSNDNPKPAAGRTPWAKRAA